MTQISATGADIDNLYVSDASESHAFVYKADGSFEYVRGFEFDEEQAKGGIRPQRTVSNSSGAFIRC